MPRRIIPLEERFWAKVDKNGPVPGHAPELGPCWAWTAADDGYGYGVIGMGSRSDGVDKAPRVSWLLHRGPIPTGLRVLHRCDHPPCVRPDHLFLGNQAANMRDMRSKDRPRGCPRKLSDAQVVEIKESIAAGVHHVQIAAEHEVSRATIRDIAIGRSRAIPIPHPIPRRR